MTNRTTTLHCRQDLGFGSGITIHTCMGNTEALPTIQRTDLITMRLHYLFRWAPSHQPVSALQRAVFRYRGVAL